MGTGRHLPRRALRAGVLLVAGVLVAGSAGAAEEKKASQPGALTRIVDTGEIRIGTSGEQPPLSMLSRGGQLLGLDVALARVLANSMGVKAVFVQMPFGKLLDALEAGELDIVMSGVTITPKRSTRVTFVGPYYTSGKSLLTKSATLAQAGVAEQIDTPEHRFVALDGSTSEEFAQRALSRAKLEVTVTLEEAVQKLIAGEVDALVADRETCDYAVLRHPGAGLIASQTTFTVEPMGIVVAQASPRLANLIQIYLTALDDSGALAKATDFWFKDSSWVKDVR